MNKNPIRVIEGEAKPHEPFWRVRDEVDGEEPQMEFYGPISEYSWFGDEITPGLFKKDLYSLGKNGPVTVHIDSPGGDVWAASTIRAIMMDYPGDITVKIDGLCASAAVMVAMAGDKVLMQESGYMMIHDPWTIAVGSSTDMKTVAKALDVCKDGIVDCYETRTQLGRSKLEKMMTDETWMNARTAKDLGFVDEVIQGKSVAMNATPVLLNCLQNYAHIPEGLLNAKVEIVKDEPATSAQVEETKEKNEGINEQEVKSLRDYLDIFAKGAKK